MQKSLVYFPDADSLAPARYFSHFGGGPLSPQKRLMLAVMEDAIECFWKYARARDGRSERLSLEAEEWILEQNSDWPFSFENICEALNLDPKYLRRGLLKKQQLIIGAPKEKFRFKSSTIINRATRITEPPAANSQSVPARA